MSWLQVVFVSLRLSCFFFFFRKIVIKQLWYFTSDHLNLIAITLSKSILKKTQKKKVKWFWNKYDMYIWHHLTSTELRKGNLASVKMFLLHSLVLSVVCEANLFLAFVEANHILICVSLDGIHVKTSLVIDSLSVSSRRGYSGCGIIDTRTIWFVFLLILSRWRVFFLGSPALHYAGPDRLQMVGVHFPMMMYEEQSRMKPVKALVHGLVHAHEWNYFFPIYY